MFKTPPCDKLLLLVCGSIHAASLPTYLHAFRPAFATDIETVCTKHSTRFIQPEVLSLYTDRRVHVDDAWDGSSGAPHIRLSRWAQVTLVLPCTANMLGKAAAGVADDLVSTIILSSPPPVIFAPAMNPDMWTSAQVKRNVKTLRADGHLVMEPTIGVSVTTGERDIGLGPTPDRVVAYLWHVRLRNLRDSYFAEATQEAPRTLSSLVGNRQLLPLSTK